jgi:hypothetical protein
MIGSGMFWLSQFRMTSKTARLFVPNMFTLVVPLNLPPNEGSSRSMTVAGATAWVGAGVDGVTGCIIRRPSCSAAALSLGVIVSVYDQERDVVEIRAGEPGPREVGWSPRKEHALQ